MMQLELGPQNGIWFLEARFQITGLAATLIAIVRPQKSPKRSPSRLTVSPSKFASIIYSDQRTDDAEYYIVRSTKKNVSHRLSFLILTSYRPIFPLRCIKQRLGTGDQPLLRTSRLIFKQKVQIGVTRGKLKFTIWTVSWAQLHSRRFFANVVGSHANPKATVTSPGIVTCNITWLTLASPLPQ